MKKLILIFGDLASGKSTFAKKISELYSIPLFTKDKIKELLADTVGFETREENLRLSKAAFELMLSNAENILNAGKDLILEANFRSAELERLEQTAKAAGAKVLHLYLTADFDILYERYKERARQNRHRAHLATDFETIEKFKEYVESQRVKEPPMSYLTISANTFNYQSDQDLLSCIGSFLINN